MTHELPTARAARPPDVHAGITNGVVVAATKLDRHLAGEGFREDLLQLEVQRLCRRARSISLFVQLWCHQESRAAANQLAATEQFPWPLPATEMDPCDLMADILSWEVP